MKNWQQKRKADLLEKQLIFFGAKKQRFISTYAKKPRIIMQAKVKLAPPSLASEMARRMQGSALYQHQLTAGMQNSHMELLQREMAGRRDANW